MWRRGVDITIAIDSLSGCGVLHGVNRYEVEDDQGHIHRSSRAFGRHRAAVADPANVQKSSTDFKKGSYNKIGIADITVSNDNAFAVKDIKIRCVFTTKSTGR